MDEKKHNVHHAYLPVTMTWEETVRYKTVHDYMVNDCDANIHPMVCIHNNRPILRQYWEETIITENDFVVVLHLPQGGSGGSDPARIILTIGLIALSAYVPGLAGQQWAWFAGSKFAGIALSSSILIGGSYLINAILPVQSENLTSNVTSSSGTTSPTYSLSSPSNTSRIGDVIPVQYGRIRTTPALASAPWYEFDDSDSQWVYVLLALGHGYYDVEKIEFLSADISAIDGAEYTVIGPGDAVPYHDNVYTSPHVDGSEEIIRPTDTLTIGPETYINIYSAGTPYFTITTDTDLLQLAPGDRVYFSGATINTDTYTIKYVSDLLGTYIAVIEESFTNEIISNGSVVRLSDYRDTNAWPLKHRDDSDIYDRTAYVDIVFPNGLYKANTDGTIESATVTLQIFLSDRGYDSSGTATIELTGEFDITRGQRESVRVSIELTIPSDSSMTFDEPYLYIRRLAGDVSSYVSNTCYWAGLRVVYDDVGSYGDITTIQIKAKASEGLSGDALSKIRVTSTRMLPIYDTEDSALLDSSSGEGWTTEIATRHIAWAIADCCRNSTYSVGRPDAELDLDALLALHQTWMSRGDYCDGVFDTKTTFWDALTTICKTGRAQPILVGGKITFIRDEYQSIYKAVFTTRNIIKNSFSIDYLMYDPETPDDVIVEYFDDDTWTWKSVTCSLPGSSSDAPATIRKWGITDTDQAEREGMYESACNLYRRTFITFETELEGRLVLRGQKVSVSHPFPSWGVSGEITNISGRNLTLSEPIEWDSGSDHYITFRDRDGTQDGPYLVDDYVSEYVITLSEDVPSHVEDDINLGRTHFQFGIDDGYHKECLVVGARPRENGIVQLTCVVEDNQVHVSDGTMDSSSGIF